MSTKRRGKPTKKAAAPKLMKTFGDIFKSGKQYRFTIVASNGETIAVGERYTRKSSAIRGAKRNSPQCVIRDKSAA